jgi:predicted MFS family arabinose efflux permease
VFGNLIAGFVASYTTWKWVFGVIAIMAAAITFAAIVIIPRPTHILREEGATFKKSVDWIGAFLITAGLLALLFALTEGNVVGWSTPWVSVLIVISVILVVLFVLWQRYLEKTGKRAPIMKVSIFKSMRFSAAMMTMALFFSSFNGFLVYATYFYQNFQGLSALQTTLRFIPTGVVGLITAAIVSQLLGVIPAWLMLAFGNFCVTVSSLLFAVPIPADTIYWANGFPAMVLSVFGADIAWPSLILFTSLALPQSDQALGAALVNAMGQVGRAIALAIATAIQTGVMARERGVEVEEVGDVVPWEHASLMGLRAAVWFNFALGCAAVVVVLAAFRGSGVIGRAKPGER